MAGVKLSGHLRLLLTEPGNSTSLESHSNGWGWHGCHSPLVLPHHTHTHPSSHANAGSVQAGSANDLHCLRVQP